MRALWEILNQSRTMGRSSLYFNPAELHSIMKKEDSEARAVLRRKLELRFLDISGQPGMDESEVSENLVNNSDWRRHNEAGTSRDSEEEEVGMDVEFQSDYCRLHSYDPEDPRCAHVTLTGNMVEINNSTSEFKFARKSLFSSHPDMSGWPQGWFFAKLNISHILVLDYFGGAKSVTPEDYFQANL